MRWTKLALLVFGAGLLLGLAVVVAELDALARVASLLMALGIVAVPVGAIIDWRRAARPAQPARGRGQPTKARASPGARGRRPRKRVPSKR
jgi:predicted lipid-binding transport protein (Tim44 family)